jgi:hypothetical protein
VQRYRRPARSGRGDSITQRLLAFANQASQRACPARMWTAPTRVCRSGVTAGPRVLVDAARWVGRGHTAATATAHCCCTRKAAAQIKPVFWTISAAAASRPAPFGPSERPRATFATGRVSVHSLPTLPEMPSVPATTTVTGAAYERYKAMDSTEGVLTFGSPVSRQKVRATPQNMPILGVFCTRQITTDAQTKPAPPRQQVEKGTSSIPHSRCAHAVRASWVGL